MNRCIKNLISRSADINLSPPLSNFASTFLLAKREGEKEKEKEKKREKKRRDEEKKKREKSGKTKKNHRIQEEEDGEEERRTNENLPFFLSIVTLYYHPCPLPLSPPPFTLLLPLPSSSPTSPNTSPPTCSTSPPTPSVHHKNNTSSSPSHKTSTFLQILLQNIILQ